MNLKKRKKKKGKNQPGKKTLQSEGAAMPEAI